MLIVPIVERGEVKGIVTARTSSGRSPSGSAVAKVVSLPLVGGGHRARWMTKPMGADARRWDSPGDRRVDRKGNEMGIVSWIVLGTIVGVLANWLLPGRFPGGVLGTISGGMAGAFLGGAIFSLVASRGVSGLDAVSLLIAFVGATLLLTIVRKAGHAEPGTR